MDTTNLPAACKLQHALWDSCNAYVNNNASAQKFLRTFQYRTLTNDSSMEMGPLNPSFRDPNHRVVYREPVFVPAFNNIRRAALLHAETEVRTTYQDLQKVEDRLQQTSTWSGAGREGRSTDDREALQRERTKLLDRLVDLIPKYGIGSQPQMMSNR